MRDHNTLDGGPPPAAVYLGKALASLAGAELQLAHGLFNNAVNRSYYAAYQAAVAGLVAEGVEPSLECYWPHDFVQAQFPALLIDERCCYPVQLRPLLKMLFDERLKADYEPDLIDPQSAGEAVRRARRFVECVAARVGEP